MLGVIDLPGTIFRLSVEENIQIRYGTWMHITYFVSILSISYGNKRHFEFVFHRKFYAVNTQSNLCTEQLFTTSCFANPSVDNSASAAVTMRLLLN